MYKVGIGYDVHQFKIGESFVLGGVEIDFEKVIFKGLVLKGIYGREMFETWYKMSSMVRAGLDPSAVITHEFDASDFENAFETMLSGKSGKVILHLSLIHI